LSSDIYALIYAKLDTIFLKYPIRICFHGDVPDPQIQDEVRHVIQGHYMLILHNKNENLRINLLKTVVTAILGTIWLAIYFATGSFREKQFG